MKFELPPLPPTLELETSKVLKQLIKSHKNLAELKGIAKTIPDENILIDTLTLQEAKQSSEIENIITTHDDLYKANVLIESKNGNAKEVYNYARGLRLGFLIVKKEKLLLNRDILTIQQKLLDNDAGFRTQAGTTLVNSKGQTIYTPPQHPDDVIALMTNLEKYINDDSLSSVDHLIKMAVIHYQFESIHPFYDGNGRTGRILNILYLVQKDLLDIPILYLSRYITDHKTDYYKVLQNVRTENDWESLILYLLVGIEITARQTIDLVIAIKKEMQAYKVKLRSELPKVYSQDLLNNLFKNPYTKIEFLEKDLKITRQTASTYLDKMTQVGLLEKMKKGKSNYYINSSLINVLTNQAT